MIFYVRSKYEHMMGGSWTDRLPVLKVEGHPENSREQFWELARAASGYEGHAKRYRHAWYLALASIIYR